MTRRHGKTGTRQSRLSSEHYSFQLKWSALKVSAAMDMAEEFANQADELLEQAKIVATEARKIANLPRYLDRHLSRLIGDIERIDYVKGTIRSVRNSLPDEALEAERRSVENGN